MSQYPSSMRSVLGLIKDYSVDYDLDKEILLPEKLSSKIEKVFHKYKINDYSEFDYKPLMDKSYELRPYLNGYFTPEEVDGLLKVHIVHKFSK